MQLLDLLKSQEPSELAKYVTVVLDEMYMREGLVFQKSSGALIWVKLIICLMMQKDSTKIQMNIESH